MSYVGKPIGMQSLTFFPLTADPQGGKSTYGTAVKVGRAIRGTLSPQAANALLESDDSVEDDLTLTLGYEINFDVSQIIDEVRAQLFGHEIDDHGGIIVKKTDASIEGALAWRTLLSSKDGKEQYKYYVLYKVRLNEFPENFETLKRGGIAFQTHNGVTGTAMARESDGEILYALRSDQALFDATKADAWFTTVQEKKVTASP